MMFELESQNIEYKIEWKEDFLRQIASFANTDGGKLLLGIADDKSIIGFNDNELIDLLDNIPKKIRDKLAFTPSVEVIEKEGKKIIEIIIDKQQQPIFLNSQIYVRSGSNTMKLMQNDYLQFLLNKSNVSWEDIEDATLSIEELDHSSFELFYGKIKDEKEKDRFLLADKKIVLQNLDLIRNNRLIRAAILLFYSRPNAIFNGARVKIGKFNDVAELIFDDVIEGALIHQVEITLDKIKEKYIEKRYEIKNDGERIMLYQYPLEVIREIVVNALIHRDYSSQADIEIRVEPDKITFWNPGHLPNGLSFEDLDKQHPSIPVNKKIASAFYKIGYVETWGTGFIKVFNGCRRLGLIPPELSHDETGFKIVISSKKLKDDIGYVKNQILSLMRLNKSIKIEEIALKIGIETRIIDQIVTELKFAGIVRAYTSGEGTSWLVL